MPTDHIMSVDCLGNIEYIPIHKSPTAPTTKTQILDTFTGEHTPIHSFHPSVRTCEYSYLLDIQSRLGDNTNNYLPRISE